MRKAKNFLLLFFVFLKISVVFPLMEGKSDHELWDYSEFVADELTKLFPPPIKLEFEGAIYNFFFYINQKALYA